MARDVPFSSPSGLIGGRIRYAPTIGYVRSFEIPMQFSNWVRVRVQKTDLYSPPSVAYGGAYSIRPYDRVRAAFQKTVPFSSLSGSRGGRIRYAPTIGYVRSFEISMRFSNRVRMRVQKMDLYSSPSVSRGGHIRYAPTTGYVRGFEILMQHPDRARAILRNTDTISRLDGRGCLGGGAVGVTVCGGGGRE